MKKCSLTPCEGTIKAKGYCGKHYTRIMKHGTTEAAPRKSLEERLWAKVNKTPKCWLWTGGNSGGYPIIGLKPQKKTIRVSRYVYENTFGPIHTNLVVSALCKNTFCVNPLHLKTVSRKEAILNGTGLAAKNIKKTHCKNGHEFSLENTTIKVSRGRTSRKCKPCVREEHRRRRRRDKLRLQVLDKHTD
jgi:hypothetical protein